MKKIVTYCFFGLVINANAQWVQETFSNDWTLRSIHFPNPDVGYAVGVGSLAYGGVILKRTANLWDILTFKTNSSLLSVYFTDTLNGYVVGGNCNAEILKTTDGGKTWTSQIFFHDVLNSVYFPTANKGFAVGGYGSIMTTDNSGESWEVKCVATDERLNSIYFPDVITGYIAGRNGTILKTSDGGSSWISQVSGTSEDLFCVHFTDAENGIVAGAHGAILKTVNGGNDWHKVYSGTTANLFDVHFIDSGTVFAVGGDFLKSTDGGDSWAVMRNNILESVSSVYFTNAEIGYLATRHIYKTNNGGNYIADKTFHNPIHIYPNPAHSSTMLVVDSEFSEALLNIYDASGRVVKKAEISKKKSQLDLDGLSSGIYCLQLINKESKIATETFLID